MVWVNWVWEKAGVSRDDYVSDIRNRSTASMRRLMADFIREKMARDLFKTQIQLRELVREKETKCKIPQIPEDLSAPKITTRLSETDGTTLRLLLKQFEVLKNTMKNSLDTEKLPKQLKECQAISKLFNSGQQPFDFSKEFHLCSWITQYENLENVNDLTSQPEVTVTSLADILLLLTNTGAVSEFLMIQHMKNLQEYEKLDKTNKQRHT
ncbi:uncharacterized protein LOC111118275 isoform X2 [Crassostrea virginica]